MEITIRGLSCSILEAICPNCHLSISSPFHSLMSLWSKALTWVSLLHWRGEVFFVCFFTPALSIGLLQQDHIIVNNFGGMQKKKNKTKRRNTGIILFCLHLCTVEAELGRIARHNSGAVNNSWGRVQGPNEKREEKRKRPLAMFSDHSHCRQKGQQIQIIRRPTGQTSGSVQNWCHVKGHEPWLEAARWKRVS